MSDGLTVRVRVVNRGRAVLSVPGRPGVGGIVVRDSEGLRVEMADSGMVVGYARSFGAAGLLFGRYLNLHSAFTVQLGGDRA